MRKSTLIILVVALALAVMPMGASAQDKCVITFLTVWSGQDELPNWENMVKPFTEKTGCTIEAESTRDLNTVLTTRVEAGNPPDITAAPSSSTMRTFIDGGELVPLDFLDMDRMKKQFGDVWLNLGTVDGKLYSVFVRAAIKSLVWYSPPAFKDAGYEVPKTWDELLKLCDQIVKDGASCFSIGLESGAASGWPATDWIEDIMLRTTSLDNYDAWVNHTIPWTGPEVTHAWETFGKIVGNPDYQFGGTAGTLSTNFGDAACPLFTNPPGAYLHRQASFIQSFIMKCPGGDKLVPGTDFDFFPFPTIDKEYGNPGLGAADSFVLFKDNENTRALIEFLTQPDTMSGWLKGGGSGIAVNKEFPMDLYPDALTRRAAEVLAGVDSFRYDASDQMPGDVNQAFWTGTLDFVRDPKSLPDILKTIEDIAAKSYKSS